MIQWWQHIPEQLDPIALAVGSFSLYWYAIFFLAGWLAMYVIAVWEYRRGKVSLGRNDIDTLFLVGFLGAIIGGRIGYAIWYEPSLFASPMSLVSPYDATGEWTGISGMSYFGGVLGVAALLGVLSWWKRWNFLLIADFLVAIVPVALFFGRIGNFVNGELPGRATDVIWGMYFQLDGYSVLRHPSTLYEAFFEGIVLYVFLRMIQKKNVPAGFLSAAFLVLYGGIRFVLEYVREPERLFFVGEAAALSMGQLLSLGTIAFGALFSISIYHKKYDILKKG